MPISKEKKAKIENVKEVLDLSNSLMVKKIAHYHYRINNNIDIYPYTKRYHNLITGERGTYSGHKLDSFILKYIDTGRKEKADKVMEYAKSKVEPYIIDVLMDINNNNEYNITIAIDEFIDFLAKNK